MAAVQHGPATQKLPLLPYEKQLIDLLGWSEEEYGYFQSQLDDRLKPRPAEYEHIPDIRNEPISLTTILVNLAIGLVLTGVAMLLAPKPRQQEQDEQQSLQLDSRTGPSRFNSTFGFGSQAALAAYGKPITLIFGYYDPVSEPSELVDTGGIVATPSLVWSRMLSYGTYQLVQCLYVVGESGVSTPSREGIWLGDNSLRYIDQEGSKIYWSSDSGGNRIKEKHRLPPGSQSGEGEIFQAPTLDAAQADGFCMTYTPSNQTVFGVYNSIPNGTGYRVNYKVISVPTDLKEDDRLKEERKKITGSRGQMTGYGRMYGRFQGIRRVIFKDGGEANPSNRTLYEISIGDKVEFWIDEKRMDPDLYDEDVETEDLTNTLDQERIDSDNALQLGETFIIGKSLWRVVDRTRDVYELRKKSVSVTLECFEIQGRNDLAETIGVVGDRLIKKDVQNLGGKDQGPDNFVQANFFNLLQYESAIIRNQRPCDVTEIGIKSNVWLKFNGLCNFNDILQGDDLEKYDEDNVQIQSGNMNLYGTRYSCFSLLVRKAGTPYGENYPWEGVGGLIAIKGSKPVDQYNYIRIKPSNVGQYEYQLAPRSGAYVTRQPSDNQVTVLNAAGGQLTTKTYSNQYGNFSLTFSGEMVVKESIEQSRLMWGPGGEGQPPIYGDGGVPSGATLDYYLSPQTQGQAHGYKWEKYGDPPSEDGRRKTVTETYNNLQDSSDTVTLKFTAESVYVGENFADQDSVWVETNVEVVGYTGDWSSGGDIVDVYFTDERNPYLGQYAGESGNTGKIRAVYKISASQGQVIISPGKESGTRFETDTQVTEESYYGDLITRSCDSGPENEIAYVNETRSYSDTAEPQYDGMTMFGIELKASRAFTALNQPRIWLDGGIKMEKIKNGIVSETNNFANIVYWLLTNEKSGLGEFVSPDLVDKDAMIRTARFLDKNNLHFDGAIEEAINARSYITSVAPNMLCNFTITNGKFALLPGVPTDDSGEWDIVVPIKAQFSEGNILTDSFELSYLAFEERQPMRVEMTYRRGGKNQLPEQRTVLMSYKYQPNSTDLMPTDVPIERFDVSKYVTRRGHAGTIARYLLSIRRHIDHTIQFATDPDEMNGVAPGDFIKVTTEMNPYFPRMYGVVQSDGRVHSAYTIEDGEYQVLYYRPELQSVVEAKMRIIDGRVDAPELAGAVFTVRSEEEATVNTYMIEQVTLNEDMTVQVVASYHPVDDDGKSIISKETFYKQTDNTDTFISLPI